MPGRFVRSDVLLVIAAFLFVAGCHHRESVTVPSPVAAQKSTTQERKPEPTKREVTEPFPTPSIESRSLPSGGAAIGLETIYFDFDRSDLSADDRRRLQQDANWLKAHLKDRILIAGNCDERGTISYNVALGDRRAEAARRYLVNLGIDLSRIRTVSYGKERPVDPEHNDVAWAKNRRDDFSRIVSDSLAQK